MGVPPSVSRRFASSATTVSSVELGASRRPEPDAPAEIVTGTDPMAQGQGTATSGTGALDLNGNTFLRIPDSEFIDQTGTSSAFSLALWVRHAFNESEPGGMIVSRGSSEGNQTQFKLYLGAIIPTRPAEKLVSFSVDVDNAGGRGIVAEMPIPRGRWTHIVAQRDSGAIRLYINGLLATQSTVADVSLEPDSTPLVVGAEIYEGRVRSFFEGSLDELKLYGRALNEQEIQALARRPPG